MRQKKTNSRQEELQSDYNIFLFRPNIGVDQVVFQISGQGFESSQQMATEPLLKVLVLTVWAFISK